MWYIATWLPARRTQSSPYDSKYIPITVLSPHLIAAYYSPVYMHHNYVACPRLGRRMGGFQEFALTSSLPVSNSVDGSPCPRRDIPIGCPAAEGSLDPEASTPSQHLVCTDESPFTKVTAMHSPTSFLWKCPFPHNFLRFPLIKKKLVLLEFISRQGNPDNGLIIVSQSRGWEKWLLY